MMPNTPQPPVEGDELLTPKQVSALTKLKTRTLADRRWKGTGPDFIKLSPGRNGHVRYWRSVVLAWLDGRHAAIE